MNLLRSVTFGIKGYLEFVQSSFLAKQEKFIAAETDVDLKDEYVMITGANSGIGKQAAIDIAKKGATVYMVCRNEERGKEARQEIITNSQNEKIHLLLCDLSSPQETLKFARSFTESQQPLTVLCANAGVLLNEFKVIDGKYEATFATNTLAIHILVREFANALKQVVDPKVFITTSGGALPAKLDVACQSIVAPVKFDGVSVYAQTKRQEIEMAGMYGREYPKLFFASWHPGWVDTPGVETSLPAFYNKFKAKLRKPEAGADTLVWLTCLRNPLQRFANGDFFFDREVVPKHLMWGGTQVPAAAVGDFISKLDEFYEQEKKIFDGK